MFEASLRLSTSTGSLQVASILSKVLGSQLFAHHKWNTSHRCVHG